MNDDSQFRKKLKKFSGFASESEVEKWKKNVTLEVRQYQKNIFPMRLIPMATAASIGFLVGGMVFGFGKPTNLNNAEIKKETQIQENFESDATEEFVRIND